MFGGTPLASEPRLDGDAVETEGLSSRSVVSTTVGAKTEPRLVTVLIILC